MLAGEEELTVADNELLGRYLIAGDSDALEQLIRRHSAMVMGVCRNLLLHRQDAEDAFQATFLVLARKASKLTKRGSIAGWLYEVAVRNCLQLRRKKGRARETEMVEEPRTSAEEPWLSISHAQESNAVHTEIKRLPERYREVIVLCHIQGYSRQRAAELLDTTEASVKASLARGRNLLRRRLIKQGIVLTAVLGMMRTATAYAGDSVSDSLLASTLQICQSAGPVPAGGGPPAGEPGGIPEVIQQLASSGAGMSTPVLLKTFIAAALVCGALVVPVKFFGQSSPRESVISLDGAVAVAEVQPIDMSLVASESDRRDGDEATRALRDEWNRFWFISAPEQTTEQEDELVRSSTSARDDNPFRAVPEDEPFGGSDSPFGPGDGPFGNSDNPFGDDEPFGDSGSPFGNEDEPFAGDGNPFAQDQEPAGSDAGDDSSEGIGVGGELTDHQLEEAATLQQEFYRQFEQQKLVIEQQNNEINRLRAQVRELQNAAEVFRVENRNLKEYINQSQVESDASVGGGAGTSTTPEDPVSEFEPVQAEPKNENSYLIEDSAEYWELMLQSFEARIDAKERSLQVPISGAERAVAQAEIYELQAKIVEARLNISRIDAVSERGNETARDRSAVPPPASDKIVEPGDRLRIEVVTDSTFNRVVTVAQDHTVSLPFVGVIDVRGLSPEQIAAKVAAGLREFIRLQDRRSVFVSYAGTSEPADNTGSR
ncbi:MAG: sigma-70 family RNA polymerase sigma factor [Planctomycetota bacterium]